MIKEKIRIGGVYQHFRGKERYYRVIRTSLDANKPEKELVLYEQLYENKNFPKGTYWTRSLEDFLGYKTLKEGKHKVKIKRFTLTSEE